MNWYQISQEFKWNDCDEDLTLIFVSMLSHLIFKVIPSFVLDPAVCLLDYFGYIPSLTHTLGSCIRLSVKLFTLVNSCEFYSRTMYVFSLQVHPTHGMVWLLMLTCTFVDCAKLLLHSIDLHFHIIDRTSDTFYIWHKNVYF